jgi:predicted ATPase/DNA-binding XRE family transcriptional regulator
MLYNRPMTQTFSPSFGAYLRQMRKRAGMTQGDLAAAVGYSVSFISSLEKQSRPPDVDSVARAFVPALALQDEPLLASRLVELAAAARGQPPPTALTVSRPSRLILGDPFSALPIPPAPLLGRDAEVRALCNRLLGHGGRLMTLLGPPGIGKSRLALEIATHLHSAWRDGATFIALAALDDPALLAITLAHALHLPADASQNPSARLVGHLRRKEMLLVLDNFEQIIPAAPLVADLLAECPGLRVLVTSRERLHLRTEQRVQVQPLDPSAAAALFVQRGQAVQWNFAPGDEDWATIAAICQRLDRLPLAIELSAARLDAFSPPQILAQIRERRLDLSSDGSPHLPPHQRTLAAAIQRSYQLLPASGQRLFRWLGVFAGSFSDEAVAGLGADPAGLRLLVSHSLLQAEPQAGENRYRLLETLREFATGRLAEAGEENAAHLRQVQWLLGLVRQADAAMRTSDRPRWLARLDAEWDNLRGGLGWAVHAAPADALALAGTLQEFWYSRGYNDEGRLWLGRALAAAPAPSPDRVRALNTLGQLLAQQSRLTEALAVLGEATALARSLGDGAGLAESLRLTGWVAYDAHDRPTALLCFGESLTHFQTVGDSLRAADVLASLAHLGVISPTRDSTQIQQWLAESLAVYRAAEDLPGLIFAFLQLGQLAMMEEAYLEAVDFYSESLALARTLGQRPEIAWGLELLGEAHWLAGHVADAEICWQEAHSHFLYLGSREATAITQHHLGQVARRQGRLAEAAIHYAESLAAHQEMGNRHMTARCLAGLGAVALAQGGGEEAGRLLGAAQAIFAELPAFLPPADAAEFALLLAQCESLYGLDTTSNSSTE